MDTKLTAGLFPSDKLVSTTENAGHGHMLPLCLFDPRIPTSGTRVPLGEVVLSHGLDLRTLGIINVPVKSHVVSFQGFRALSPGEGGVGGGNMVARATIWKHI